MRKVLQGCTQLASGCVRAARCSGSGGRFLVQARCLSSRLQRNPFEDLTSESEQARGQQKSEKDPELEVVKKASTDYFHGNDNANVHDIRSGSFVKVDLDQLKKAIPEGLPKSITDEFQLSFHNKWMVRDSTKLLYRLLEETEATLNHPNRLPSYEPTRGLETPVVFPQITDRPEWEQAAMQYHVWGKEVVADREPVMESGFVVSKGPGSLVENFVSGIKAKALPKKLVIAGDRGAGKTALMYQLVHHARQRGWLALFVPGGWDQVQSGPYIDEMKYPFYPGEQVYDNPHMSAVVLRGFWHAHNSLLRSLPIQTKGLADKYVPVLQDFREKWRRAQGFHKGGEKVSFVKVRQIVLAEEETEETNTDELDEQVLSGFNLSSFELTTLEDLVMFGVAFGDWAGAVFTDLVAELKKVESVPVLLAVDEYNTWLDKSAFYYEYQRVQGMQLAVPRALKFVHTTKAGGEDFVLKNGLCVAATSHFHPEGRNAPFTNVKASLEGLLTVPCYNRVEFLSAMSNYMNFGCLVSGLSTNEICAFRTYSGSLGGNVRKDLPGYAIPLDMERNAALHDEALWSPKGDEEDEEAAASEDTDLPSDDEFDVHDAEEEVERAPAPKTASARKKGKK